MKLFSNPRFLAVYSGVLTITFVAVVLAARGRSDLLIPQQAAARL